MTERDSLGRAVELLSEAARLLAREAMGLKEGGLRAIAIIGVEHEPAAPRGAAKARRDGGTNPRYVTRHTNTA